MNAARLARGMIEDGVDPKLAQSLSEHLADEIERSVATRDQVELIVTREVQQLRVEMTEQIQALRTEMHGEINALRTEMHEGIQGLRTEMQQELRRLSERIDDSFTTQFRWMIGMFVTIVVAVVLNLGAVVLGLVIG